jgi:hypothetical protein
VGRLCALPATVRPPPALVKLQSNLREVAPGRCSHPGRMPRYFFDQHDQHDQIGLELDGPEQARAEAVRALTDIARDVLPNGEKLSLIVAVREGDGPVFFRASLTFQCN